jgi:fatty acid desaturase
MISKRTTRSSRLEEVSFHRDELRKQQIAVLEEHDSRKDAQEYSELKQLVKAGGLLSKQPMYYVWKILLLLSLLALGVIFLMFVHSFWLRLLNALYLAFVYIQFGLLGHDAGHRQMFSSSWKHDLVGLLVANFLLGLSRAMWIDRHNKHHSHPNQVSLDPDLAIPFLLFEEENCIAPKGRFSKFFVKYQAYFFFPSLALLMFDWQYRSILSLLQNKVRKYRHIEAMLLVVHFVAYLGLLFSQLELWQALLFILVHQGFAGIYMGLVFAPNHKGMPVLPEGSKIGYLRHQVITARNIYAHPVIDFLYGGLNYQIEHHLFPSMARNKLKEAQRVVKAFCKERSIVYYETNFIESFVEIIRQLHQVGATVHAKS